MGPKNNEKTTSGEEVGMDNKIKVAVVVGTRPEAIKLAPVILELFKYSDVIEPVVINTRQHPKAVDEVFDIFGIAADAFLSVQEERQSLGCLTSKLITQLDEKFNKIRPDFVVVQGDTTSVLCGALAGFYQNARIVHVEAGLRTSDLRLPFPEEMNRRVVSKISEINCAPTQKAYYTLLSEGVDSEDISLTQNTIVDALEFVINKNIKDNNLPKETGYLLVTMHRRENWGEGISIACSAIKRICALHKDLKVKFATHVNPEIQRAVKTELKGIANVELLPPVRYDNFIALMQGAQLIMSDSGGIAEEAPSLGAHVLITRTETERTEAIDGGFATLVGTNVDLIVEKAEEYLFLGNQASPKPNPFGDGHASERIVQEILLRSNL